MINLRRFFMCGEVVFSHPIGIYILDVNARDDRASGV